MKKNLFLILGGLPVLFLGGCSLINNNDNTTNTGNIEEISQLQQQMSGLLGQFSGLQTENKNLKKSLSGSLAKIQTLQSGNEALQANVDKYKKIIIENKLNNKNITTTPPNNTTVKNNMIYKNTTYNFNLTFPNTRNGYITKTNGNETNFGFNEQMSLFTITALTHNERGNIQNDAIKPTYLGENKNYVFIYSIAQDAANQTIINRMEEINNILQTFQTTANNTQTPVYNVKTEPGEGNSDIIYVYNDGKLIFKLDPINGLGTYYKIIGKILFVDYGTAVGGRTIKLLDISNNGKIIFETRYNGEIKIKGNSLYFNFSFPPDTQGINCDNYEEIKNMGGSINYEQKRYYNFKEDKLVNIGNIYCAYGE